MPSLPEPALVAGLDAALRGLTGIAEDAEDALFSLLPVLGDPDLQRAVDQWIDQAVDTTRALAAAAAEESTRLALLTDDAAGATPESERSAPVELRTSP